MMSAGLARELRSREGCTGRQVFERQLQMSILDKQGESHGQKQEWLQAGLPDDQQDTSVHGGIFPCQITSFFV